MRACLVYKRSKLVKKINFIIDRMLCVCVCACVLACVTQVKTQRTGFLCSCRDIILSDNCRSSLLVGPLYLQNFDVQLTTCSLGGTDVWETNDEKKSSSALCKSGK